MDFAKIYQNELAVQSKFILFQLMKQVILDKHLHFNISWMNQRVRFQSGALIDGIKFLGALNNECAYSRMRLFSAFYGIGRYLSMFKRLLHLFNQIFVAQMRMGHTPWILPIYSRQLGWTLYLFPKSLIIGLLR